jgi:eukaryotic-like serine/threonine-protein kinase
MGVVYEAFHVDVGRRFALKFLQSDLRNDTEAVLRFQREAKLAGSLDSPNLAAVVDYGGASSGQPFLVMEYLEGRSLASLLLEFKRLPVPRAIRILRQACEGMAMAHARGIVHRDLKPAHLFLCPRSDESERIKILDFGIGSIGVDDGTSTLTERGVVLGTPMYMAPEQARGEHPVDARADVYALGAILYEALGGQAPHQGESRNALLYSVMTREPPPLSKLRPELPRSLLRVVACALAKSPSDRFQDAAELGGALARLESARPDSPRRDSDASTLRNAGAPPLPAAADPAVSGTHDADMAARARRASRLHFPSRWVPVVAIAAFVLAGFAFARTWAKEEPRTNTNSSSSSTPSRSAFARASEGVTRAPSTVSPSASPSAVQVKPPSRSPSTVRPREQATTPTPVAPDDFDRSNPY